MDDELGETSAERVASDLAIAPKSKSGGLISATDPLARPGTTAEYPIDLTLHPGPEMDPKKGSALTRKLKRKLPPRPRKVKSQRASIILRVIIVREEIDNSNLVYRWNNRRKRWCTGDCDPILYNIGRNGVHSWCLIEVRPNGFGLPIWLKMADEEFWEGVYDETRVLRVTYSKLSRMVEKGISGEGILLDIRS